MKLYNTLTKKIEEINIASGDKINVFVCGPTVYDLAQLGNAKTYTQMDLMVRTLRMFGYQVNYLQNITDIDDKIIARAAEKEISCDQLAKEYENEYLQDMKWLGNTSVNEYVRATDHIDEIIDQIERLMAQGFVYKIDGDGIYFEIAKFVDYGKLSGRQQVGKDDAESRIDESESKKGWNDFCVWKFSKPGEPKWEAPFGRGRPGWHIEDTAITEKFFGPQYDIHGGAVDLIFPHHEAELTLMESLSSKVPFVKYWTHAGFLTVDGKRMGKSEGNFITIRDVSLKGYTPEALRLFFLKTHYRKEINFSWNALNQSQASLKSMQDMADIKWQASSAGKLDKKQIENTKKTISAALSNDLNTSQALNALNELETNIDNSGINASCQEAFNDFLIWLDDIFGFNLSRRSDINDQQRQTINDREKARLNKDWATSDFLREKLLHDGVIIKDKDTGPVWARI
jgi:cysteinyl-tRNA synthetase